MLRHKLAAVLALVLISAAALSAQSTSSESERAADKATPDTTSPNSGASAPKTSSGGSSGATGGATDPYQQPKRILGIIPNFRAVSADSHLPPLSVGGKFWLATKSSFDYSSVIVVGTQAGISQASDSQSEFGQGGAGYGRRFWHAYADMAIGNYLTTAILPSITREDPRYYALGRGTVLHRTGYAVSRLFVIKNDEGHWTANFSEIPGNGIAAGLSNLYYPSSHRGWVDTYQRWAVQIGMDAASDLLKEFWPDIASKLFRHSKDNTQQGSNNP